MCVFENSIESKDYIQNELESLESLWFCMGYSEMTYEEKDIIYKYVKNIKYLEINLTTDIHKFKK